MKRIVAGLDGSDASYRAMALAVEIARRFGSRLTIVTVVPPLPVPGEALHDDHFEAERILEEGTARLDAPGLLIDRVVLFGSPAEALCNLAHAEEVDLVIVGRSGRSSVSRMLLGSVSDRLVHRCTKPVLVVH